MTSTSKCGLGAYQLEVVVRELRSFLWSGEDPPHVLARCSRMSYLRSAIDMSERPVSDLTPLTAAMVSLLV